MDSMGNNIMPSTSRTKEEIFRDLDAGKIKASDVPDDLFFEYMDQLDVPDVSFDPGDLSYIDDYEDGVIANGEGFLPEVSLPSFEGPTGPRGRDPGASREGLTFDEMMETVNPGGIEGGRRRGGGSSGAAFDLPFPGWLDITTGDGSASAAPLPDDGGWEFDPETDMPPMAAGADAPMPEDTNPTGMPEDEVLDITLPPGFDQGAADSVATELQKSDADAGGASVKGDTGFGSGLRDKVFGFLGADDDPEERSRWRRAFAAGGAEILANPSGSWQGALGTGVKAGIADYDDTKEASLQEEVERQKMNIAQEAMERARRNEGRAASKDAHARSMDILEAQRKGFVFDDEGNPIGYSKKKADEYGGGSQYDGLTGTQEGKVRIAEILYGNDPDAFADALDRIIGGRNTNDLDALLEGAQ